MKQTISQTAPAQPARSASRGTRSCNSGFVPHRLLTNAHLQTLAPALAALPLPALRRRRLELPDGDFVDIGVCRAAPRHTRTALLVHGLGGLMRAPYLISMAHTLFAKGWNVVALELRGAGEEPNRLARSYHHGDTEDFRYLCRELHQNQPDHPIVAIGWSLGAGIVLKALGEDGDGSLVQAAVAISTPFQIRECADHLRSGISAWYERALLAHVKRVVRRKHSRMPPPESIDLDAALQARDFMSFGDAYTARINGYTDIDDYCSKASCRRYLASIARPTLIVHAMDDPITPASSLPPPGALPSHVTVELSHSGGHVGFVESGRWGLPALWLNRRIPVFLEAAMDDLKKARNERTPSQRPVIHRH